MADPQMDPGAKPADSSRADELSASHLLPVPAPATENAPTVISSSLRPRGENHFTEQLRGRRLAHFELEEPIGVGGMAAVIRARDTQLDRKVALKILPPEMAADPENVRRFEHEARAAARLDHENVARVYFCGADQGLHFIAFEFVEGQNLRAMMDARGRIPVGEAVHYVLQIATGLAHAAERGVVHRDIKPSNIIVGENGRAKLVDMGLARSLHTPVGKDLTQSGVTLGTFDYISPEQALEPRAADVRSDIYSLGCTLYHMLTGRPPVPDGTAARKLQFHQHGAPIDPRQLNPEIPDELAAILSRMMAKEPSARYQRPEFLVQHLLAVAQQLSGAQNGPPPGVLFLDSILPAPPKTNPLVVLALGGLAVIVLVGLLSLWPENLGRGPEPTPAPSGKQAQGKSSRPADEGAKPAVKPLDLRPAPPVGPDVRPGGRIRTVQQLRQLASEGATGDFTLEPEGLDRLLELSASEDSLRERNPGLVFRNDVNLRNAAQNRPVLRLTHDVANPYGKEWAAITLVDGRLLLRGIRFEIDARGGAQPMAIFHVLGGQLILQHCEFVQREPPVAQTGAETDARLSVLKVLPNPAGSVAQPVIEFRNCYFAGGQDGLLLEEGAKVTIEDCVFAPYDAPFQIAGKGSHGWETALRIGDSSLLLRPRPVIALDSRQRCSISLEHSVFSQPDSDESPEGAQATLLRLGPQQSEDRCTLASKENYFHNLGTLVGQVGENNVVHQRIVDLADFERDMLDQMRDSGSVLSDESPWAESNPLKALAVSPHRAFALKSFLPGPKGDKRIAVGARDLLGQELVAKAPTASPAAGAKPTTDQGQPRELIVDGQDNFKTLASAFGAAENEDDLQIVLRLNGPVAILPLEIGDKKVRIRADKDFRPILILNARHVPGADGEAALFKVHDGELSLERLEIHLDPLRQPARFQSVVQITGAGTCRLDHCAATLSGTAEGPRLGLVAATDPTGTMMATPTKPARPGTPVIRLNECFVRGQGDLLSLRASRPFDLEVRNSLAVLAGSFLVSEGNRREASFTSPASVSLDHVTACLGQNLAVLRSTPTHPVHVPLSFTSVSQCVFTATDARPFLYLDGPASEDDLRRWLTWRGQKNVYNTTGSLLVWQPLEMSMDMQRMPQRCDAERWQRLWGGDDDQPLFNRVKFAGFPAAERSLLQALPADFQVEPTGETGNADLTSRGADVDRLPQPSRASGTSLEE